MSNRQLKIKEKRRVRSKYKIRKKVSGSDLAPRISVFRSSKHIYAQAIIDDTNNTIATASTLDDTVVKQIATIKAEAAINESKSTKSITAAKAVGIAIAEKLKAKGIERAVFDRNGFKYHGRIKSLADGIREGGLNL